MSPESRTSCSHNLLTLCRFQGTSSAQIFVGPDCQFWSLPVELLCHVSTFFRAALKGEFEEAKDKRVMLKKECPSAFKLFVLWLYKGCLFDEMDASELHEFTVQAWILGDKLGAPAFQNCLMQELVTNGGNMFHDAKLVVHIFDNTTKRSPLRKLTVDSIVYSYEDIIQGRAWRSLYLSGGDVMVDLMKALQQSWTSVEEQSWDDPAKYLVTI